MKKRKMAICAMLAVTIGLSGCGGGKPPQKGSSTNDEVIWYLRHDEQKDAEEVLAAINEVVEPKIGAKLVVKRIDGVNYSEKLKLAMTANESFDICHMAPRYNFYTHVAKNAFKPLDELLPKYAPKTYEMIPSHFWEAAKVKGKLYGVLNYQIVGRQNGFVVQKEALEKYKFDLKSVKKIEDIEPLYKAIKENEPSNVIPYLGGNFEWALTHYVGFDTIGSNSYPGVLRIKDNNYTVINQYETPEFMELVKVMRDFYLKGYIPKDAATVSNKTDLSMQGLLISFIDNVAPGYEPQFAKTMGDRPVETVVIDPPFVNTENVIATMNCVSRTSKNTEKALQFLDMINTDEGGIYNMMCFGLEGKHYKKVGEKRIEKIPNSGYDPNAAWMFGNQFNAYLIPGQEDGLWQKTIELNNNAEISKLLGFALDTEPIKIEIAQCEAVVSEYIDSITTGSVDPDEYMPIFIDKLKKANVDKIIVEKQRQIDEWRNKK